MLALEVERCESAHEFWRILDQTMRRVGFVDEGETEDQVSVEVRHNGAKPWILHASRAEASVAEWQRIAECFRSAYVKALAKWGSK